MKASDLIAKVLETQGVTHVYEMVGGMITHILDSLASNGNISIISMHHEQGAAFAAEGHARMTGKPLVAMATSGPGATNLLTGVGSCFFDSVPAVFITGQVNRHEMKGTLAIRQLGFQETDIVEMARPITKAAFQVLEPSALQSVLEDAFRIAQEGRPGPVLVDIPMDIQRAEIPWNETKETVSVPIEFLDTDVLEVLDALRSAQRPMILVGGGVRSGRAKAEFEAFLNLAKIPVAYSLMGVDCVSADSELRVGLIGSYGNRWANHAIGTCDCLLVLGSRLDIRQTGSDVGSFRGEKRIYHVDCERAEINNRVKDCTALVGQVNNFLRRCVALLDGCEIATRSDWMAAISDLKARYPDTEELAGYAGINPNGFCHELARSSRDAVAVVTDVGQHQMWSAQSYDLMVGQRFLTSGGMGSMGFALPAAIGASFAGGKAPVVMIAGDGGFQCNIQELETVRRNNLPLKMVVLDNGCHGMVRQFQESYFGSRFQSTKNGYSAPRFDAIAEAYGIRALRIESQSAVGEALEWLWSDAGPSLLVVEIGEGTNVYPKLAFGRPFTEMEPDAKPLDMEGT